MRLLYTKQFKLQLNYQVFCFHITTDVLVLLNTHNLSHHSLTLTVTISRYLSIFYLALSLCPSPCLPFSLPFVLGHIEDNIQTRAVKIHTNTRTALKPVNPWSSRCRCQWQDQLQICLRQSSFAHIRCILHKVPVAIEQKTCETKRNQNKTKLSKKQAKNTSSCVCIEMQQCFNGKQLCHVVPWIHHE